MNTEEQYMYLSLAREAAKLQKAIMNATLFGLLDINPNSMPSQSNQHLIEARLTDLEAVIGLARKNMDGLTDMADGQTALNKQVSIIKWKKYVDDKADAQAAVEAAAAAIPTLPPLTAPAMNDVVVTVNDENVD